MPNFRVSYKACLVGAVAVLLLVLLIGGTALAQMPHLNGIYVANDRSQLLVESVPVNRGERLTLNLLNVEISVNRTEVTKPFIYRHNKCELRIDPYVVEGRAAISIEAFGMCKGEDRAFDGLNIAYFGSTTSGESCSVIAFEGNSAIINGLAPPEERLCYRLDAHQGEKVTLKVLRGKNTIFSIEGMVDAQDDFTFSAEDKSYRILIGQLMRSVRPEAFRVSVTRTNMQPPALATAGRQCDGLYLYFNIGDTSQLVPTFGRRIEQHDIGLNPQNASWYDVKCDAAGRSSTVSRYSFGRHEFTFEFDFVDTFPYVAKMTTKNPDGSVRSVTVARRDSENRLVRAEIASSNGTLERFVEYKYAGDLQALRTVNALSGSSPYHAEKWFYPDGRLSRAKWYYPQNGYDYSYDHDTGLIVSQLKFNDTGPFEETKYEYDSFGNTLRRAVRCVATCDFVSFEGSFDFGLMTSETGVMATGERLAWKNKYDRDRHLSISELTVNDVFVLRFVVEMNGSVVTRTVAYAPNNRMLFIYYDRAVVYIHRNGAPIDGGKFERIVGSDAW